MQELLIAAERLQIRHLKTTDLYDFYFYRSNPDVTKHQSFDIYTLEQSNTFIQSPLKLEFGKPGEWTQFDI